jgi:6-pyruvoyltetrahydropterin/6-carboxytetrahydropterin synthase
VITLTRRYGFPAAHILSHPEFGDAENQRIYGKCANPAGHGHNYGVEVTLTGPLDARTGAIFPIDRLDTIVRQRVLDRLSHTLLNDDVWFRAAVPTAENVVLTIERELRDAVAAESQARVVRVRLLETRRNYFSCGEAEA